MSTEVLNKINQLNLMEKKIKPEIIALDGTRFTNDHTEKYYATIHKKEKATLKTILQSMLNLV
ncbi:MAG: hypothetical protein KO202_03435 [Methanobacteriaceae archaeon]|jgi:hypothetical protein|nr:hypothetical protein [Methanobacteriaceae archaeon]